MFTVAIFLVVSSGLLHAVWNLFAKQSLNKVVFLWSIQWAAVFLYLPWALTAVWNHNIPFRGCLFLVVTAALHGFYVILLSKTYSAGDLSQVYPLMRGVSPLLVPILGVSVLGEKLSALGWLGVACVVVGIWILGDWRFGRGARQTQMSARGTWLALAVGLSITAYTTFDKITLHYFPAVTLNDASNLGNLIVLSWLAIRSGAIKAEWRANWRTILLGGIISPGGYLLFLLALHMAPVAQMAPMREIGTVFGTILGVVVLREAQGTRRIAAAGLITSGVILLGTFG
ncbi:DMT family transporter [Alicyclobacillus sp. ALC3]|uniref:DMT family transporter n=1 Tax=Alicyclobacillus sp. ALC3 TaxID=2796143 RepID=UPI0023780F71|nr:DMT family transporter [Alicyclobacillus sp. ALC3]WDL96717.1 EamA family transporter [Alicyclobacillus sp. ALC3]